MLFEINGIEGLYENFGDPRIQELHKIYDNAKNKLKMLIYEKQCLCDHNFRELYVEYNERGFLKHRFMYCTICGKRLQTL